MRRGRGPTSGSHPLPGHVEVGFFRGDIARQDTEVLDADAGVGDIVDDTGLRLVRGLVLVVVVVFGEDVPGYDVQGLPILGQVMVQIHTKCLEGEDKD